MQLSSIAPTSVRTDVPTAPATRTDAAKALVAVPMGIVMVATMTAMTKSMAGQAASRADLVAPLLEKLTPETARMTMLNAIDGAVALMPEARIDVAALKQAADGVAALLTDIAGDHTQGDAQQSLERITTPLQPLMAPIMEFALLLDPTLGTKPA
jgi:hypothetical protein